MLMSDKETRTIYAYGCIGENEEFSAKGIIDHLRELGPGPVTLRLNSDGGECGEGWAIHGALERHDGQITAINDSVCASMASVIFLAGDIRLATPYSQFLLHSPHTAAAGDKQELRRRADTLDQFEKVMRSAYLKVLTCNENELIDMLEAETWLTATDAIGIGLATAIDDPSTNTVSADFVKRNSAPTAKRSASFIAKEKHARIVARFKNHKAAIFSRIISDATSQFQQKIQARLSADGVNHKLGFPGLIARLNEKPPTRSGSSRSGSSTPMRTSMADKVQTVREFHLERKEMDRLQGIKIATRMREMMASRADMEGNEKLAAVYRSAEFRRRCEAKRLERLPHQLTTSEMNIIRIEIFYWERECARRVRKRVAAMKRTQQSELPPLPYENR